MVCAQEGRCSWWPELLDPPRAGAPGSCEPVGTGNLSNVGPLQEEYILLATQLVL